MYDAEKVRKGLKLLIDNQPYLIVDFQYVKPGKGQAFTRMKIRNMITGQVLEKTYKSGERLAPADMEERQMQYLYREGDKFVFMDTTSYEQFFLEEGQVEDVKGYLIDNLPVSVLFFSGRAIGVTPPIFVELKVAETEPGFKGDTTSNVLKAAKMETGMSVQVPLFVNEGEILKIDTRTGEYVERVRSK